MGSPEHAPGELLSQTLYRTEVADTAGAVIVETRRLWAAEDDAAEDLGQSAPDPSYSHQVTAGLSTSASGDPGGTLRRWRTPTARSCGCSWPTAG
jgi:hypothetical protein